MKVINYIPEQPFFEIRTHKFISRFTSSTDLMAQYYSFTVDSESEDAVVAVPDGTIDILFHNGCSQSEAVICGSVKKGKHVHFDAKGRYFGARFLPGAAEKLLGCPLDEFTDQEFQLKDVLKNAGSTIDRIIDENCFDKQVSLFEEFISANTELKPQPFLINYILNKINHTSGDIRIQELADETGYSSRHINNVFKKHIGIAPKLYIRIVRFQRCFGLIKTNQNTDFSRVAEDIGYYDQAHFINEFKEFSLTTPGKLRWG